MAVDRIIAVGLLTERDLDLLGKTFDRAWPVEDTPDFADLIEAIDEANSKLPETRQIGPTRQGHA